MEIDAYIDLDISQEDLRNIDLLEASIFSEIPERICEEESDNDDPIPSKKRKRIFIASDSDSDDDPDETLNSRICELQDNARQSWSTPKGHQPSVIAFTEPTGTKQPYAKQLQLENIIAWLFRIRFLKKLPCKRICSQYKRDQALNHHRGHVHGNQQPQTK
ncbi:unnamed protein product [Parnassius apollo]|uniref:(apollo) hypothetical protein n=1 Tax=Parnassius apollo TaxID=110799 RepID=A0A8S3X5U5_PARAO|nr:unnamed protein product [Parnassius apollo]